jgi:hypothetical protein
VFDVPGYDMFLGIDWFESFLPMWVHWVKKTPRYKENGRKVYLKGLKHNTKRCEPISFAELQQLAEDRALERIVQLNSISENGDLEAVPVDIAQVLQQHANCSATPTTLLPHRTYDHHVVLLPGVSTS